MQTREYSALNKTAGASILAYPCTLTNMDGFLFSGTAPLYLQIFDKASAPATNDVPIKSLLITTSGPFPLVSIFQSLGPVYFALGLAVGISSTRDAYTAATATYSVFGEVEDSLQSTDSISGLSTAGDTTSHVDALAPWADGDNNNQTRLFRLDIGNVSAGDRWIMLFPYKTGAGYPVNAADHPLLQWKLSAGATRTLYFGPNGYRPFGTSLDPNNNHAPVNYYGCSIWCSSTATTLNNTAVGDMTCKAYFKVTSGA